MSNKGKEVLMMTYTALKSIALRSQATLLQDAAGAAALIVMLVVLQLPISLVRRIDSPISLGLARAAPIMIRHVAPNE